jgi:peptide-methionine (S)-S-oxide reductase
VEHAVFGGGCFWAMQSEFELLKGVQSAVPGYAGGHTANPSYMQVCSHTTGHAEVINISYDPAVISYKDLVRVFMRAHDPTTKDRQGNDVGDNYRSIILTADANQEKTAKAVLAELNRAHAYPAPIVTEIKPLTKFYQAEQYHMHYYDQHPNEPYCANVVASEIASFRTKFKDRLKR